ncbi:MAG: 50S ribosomal protein L11 methyltransferase [Litorimonas sp.]
MTDSFRPWALNITASPDAAFDLADALGMDGVMTALSVTIFDAPPDQMLVQGLFETQAAAEQAKSLLDFGQTQTLSIEQLPATDWVSETQAGLPPVRAGRFLVYGSHDADKVSEDIVPLLVDAGMAFGTGHHGTTAGCLRIFSDLLDAEAVMDTVLDLGCGAGVLAMAAAKTLPAADILATDIDPDAIMVTDANIIANDVTGRIESAVANGFDSPVLKDRQFDLIFANILAGPLMGLADDIVAATAPGGHVILSGILDEKAAQVAACFQTAGLDVIPQPSLEGWTSLLAKK